MNAVAMTVGYMVIFMLGASGLMLFFAGMVAEKKLLFALGLMGMALGIGLTAIGGWIGPGVQLQWCIMLTVFASVTFIVSLLIFGNLTAKK